jgi:hypothetical protein
MGTEKARLAAKEQHADAHCGLPEDKHEKKQG